MLGARSTSIVAQGLSRVLHRDSRLNCIRTDGSHAFTDKERKAVATARKCGDEDPPQFCDWNRQLYVKITCGTRHCAETQLDRSTALHDIAGDYTFTCGTFERRN